MEGLIPMICKTLKNNQTRRKYNRLSSSAAAQTYNISDFYLQGFSSAAIGDQSIRDAHQHHHRRHNSSITDYSSGFFAAEGTVITKPNQMVRFGSHRFFSCVTGVCLKG